MKRKAISNHLYYKESPGFFDEENEMDRRISHGLIMDDYGLGFNMWDNNIRWPDNPRHAIYMC